MEKIMRAAWLTAIVCISLIAGLADWGLCQQEQSKSPGSKANPIKLRLSVFSGSKGTIPDIIRQWEKIIEERTAGRVQIEMYWGGVLAKYGETSEAVKHGTADMGYQIQEIKENILGRIQNYMFVPKARSHMGIIRNYFKWWDKWPQAQAECTKWNCIPVLNIPVGAYDFGGTVPVKNLNDFKGKKIRTGSAEGSLLFSAVGAVPVGITSTEMYDAMSKGVLHLSIGNYELFRRYKTDEVMKHYTEAGFVQYAGNWWIVMNLDKWNSLPADIQAIFKEVQRGEFVEWSEKYLLDEMTKLKASFIKQGIKVDVLPEAERIQWRDKPEVQGIKKTWIDKAKALGYPAGEIWDSYIRLVLEPAEAYQRGLGTTK